MSQLTPLELLLVNLKGEIQQRQRGYLPKEQAYEALKFHTGQDFGDNIEKWEAWIRANPMSIKASKDVSSRVAKLLRRFGGFSG